MSELPTRSITVSNTSEDLPIPVQEPVNKRSGLRKRKGLSRTTSSVFLPRLVKRNLPFHQSSNRIAVKNEKKRSHILPLLMRDWFHVLLRMPVLASTTAMLSLWTVSILLFAAIYVRIDSVNLGTDCGLGPPGKPIPFGTAFAFSLETCTTVGCK
jgi:hypothetical protein